MESEKFEINLGNSIPNIRLSSEKDFITFWENQARSLNWFKHWSNVLDWNPPFARWFEGGLLNASYNALDIHQEEKSGKIAIYWEGEDSSQRNISYSELYTQVKKFANVLKSLGVKKGDRITIYLPMIPELVISMLGCSRIGAIHTVVFSGFSAISLKDRIEDSKSKVVITADGGFRKGKIIELKDIVDEAILDINSVEHVIVFERAKNGITLNQKDHLWSELMKLASEECEPEQLESSHPLYILYTSGTTGKPKGVLHGTGGYLTHLHSTYKWAFDNKDSDIYF